MIGAAFRVMALSLLRDRAALVMAFVLPTVIFSIFAAIFSGATGKRLRTITSTTPNEDLGFDAVGIGDTNGNGAPDFLISAANRDTVYIVDGNPIG